MKDELTREQKARIDRDLDHEPALSVSSLYEGSAVNCGGKVPHVRTDSGEWNGAWDNAVKAIEDK